MSLKDGSKKMSKSNGTDSCRIHMTDTADEIRAKIRTAKSDSIMGLTFEPETRPEVANLLTIYAALSRQSVRALCCCLLLVLLFVAHANDRSKMCRASTTTNRRPSSSAT